MSTPRTNTTSAVPRTKTTTAATTAPMSGAQASLYQQLRSHLAVLKLADAAEHLPTVLDAAAAEGLSLTAALERLLAIEVDATQARRLASRLRFACLPTPATLDDFDYDAGSEVDPHLIADLATGRYLESATIWTTLSFLTYTSWPHPTAQYGQIDFTTRSAVAVRGLRCSVCATCSRARAGRHRSPAVAAASGRAARSTSSGCRGRGPHRVSRGPSSPTRGDPTPRGRRTDGATATRRGNGGGDGLGQR